MTIKYHVGAIKVMSLPPKNVIVSITRYDDETKEIEQITSNEMTEKEAKQLESALKKAVKEKTFKWK